MYKCSECGLLVDKITTWKKNECPKDKYQHRFIGLELSKKLLKSHRFFKAKRCVICDKGFLVSIGNKIGRLTGVRQRNAITCSKECSNKLRLARPR